MYNPNKNKIFAEDWESSAKICMSWLDGLPVDQGVAYEWIFYILCSGKVLCEAQ